MKIKFIASAAKDEGIVGVCIKKDGALHTSGKHIDKSCKGAVTHFIKHQNKKDKFTDPVVITYPNGSDTITHVVLLPESENILEMGGKVAPRINALPQKSAVFYFNEAGHTADDAAEFALGILLRSWKFDKYFTKDKDKTKLIDIHIVVKDVKASESAFKIRQNIYEGVALAREVTAEPANVIYPESLANIAKTLEKDGVTVEILTPKDMKKLGMNALLGVAQGSANEARMVVLQWHGGKKGEKPVAFVGKGVTFDSGGISIKPSNKMEEMIMDMGGSAVVMGLMKAIAKNKLKVNAVGVMGLVENMPSGTAQRPGDIVKSMSGQTIEIINTDAEGRLVLADALWYTQDRFKPSAMIDLATLTGAVFIALGNRYAGLMGNDNKLIKQIEKASKATGEKVWALPLDDEFKKALKSDTADLKNSDYGVGAGSITAGQFLGCFVDKTPWAHLDIAMTAWSSKPGVLHDKRATGYGIRLLYQWVMDNYVK